MSVKQKVRGFLVIMVGLMLMFSMFGGTQAYAEDEIGVGYIGPIRFPHGKHGLAGSQIAADEINAAGGVKVKGKKYKIVIQSADSNEFASLPDAISAMERLVTRNKLKYIMGGMLSEATMAMQDVAVDNKVIFLGTGSGIDELTQRIGKNYDRYKYFFRVMATSSTDLATYYACHMAVYIRAFNKIGISKPRIALLTDQAGWTEPLVKMAEEMFPKLGGEIIGSWKTKYTATSYASELSAIKSANAHIIFHAVSGPSGSILARQWGELEIPAALVGANSDAMKDVRLFWESTNGKGNYIAVGGSLDAAITPKTLPFKAEFLKKTGEEPMHTGWGSYDALFILKAAMERADSLDPDALVPALEKTDYIGSYGRYRFSQRGQMKGGQMMVHDVLAGNDGIIQLATQIIDGKRYIVWPDGNLLPPAFETLGVGTSKWGMKRYAGTKDYVVPPWVVEYWKGKK
jgi:branched-chain amino acid transport system substrate-binding protein